MASGYYTPLEPSIKKENDKEAIVRGKRKGLKNLHKTTFTETFADNVLSVRGTVDGTVYGFDVKIEGEIGPRKLTVEKEYVEIKIPKETIFNIQLQTMA